MLPQIGVHPARPRFGRRSPSTREGTSVGRASKTRERPTDPAAPLESVAHVSHGSSFSKRVKKAAAARGRDCDPVRQSLAPNSNVGQSLLDPSRLLSLILRSTVGRKNAVVAVDQLRHRIACDARKSFERLVRREQTLALRQGDDSGGHPDGSANGHRRDRGGQAAQHRVGHDSSQPHFAANLVHHVGDGRPAQIRTLPFGLRESRIERTQRLGDAEKQAAEMHDVMPAISLANELLGLSVRIERAIRAEAQRSAAAA